MTRKKGSYTPCTEGNLQSAPTTQKWDSKPMVHPAHWPTAQCKQSENGTHALSARTAPRVLRGSYLQRGARPGPPKGPPGSGPLVPPEPRNATDTVGPPNQGRSPPANADDGAAHRRRLAVKSVPAIPLLLQGALRQREGGHQQ